MKTFKKPILNTIVAHNEMVHKFQEWKNQSPISFDMADFPGLTWCSVPEKHFDTDELLLHFVDYHHLNVRLRMSLLRRTFKFVSAEAWRKVSEMNNSVLPLPVLNGADFSKPVEKALSKLGYHKEAEFCKLVRGYMDANDSPGVLAEWWMLQIMDTRMGFPCPFHNVVIDYFSPTPFIFNK